MGKESWFVEAIDFVEPQDVFWSRADRVAGAFKFSSVVTTLLTDLKIIDISLKL